MRQLLTIALAAAVLAAGGCTHPTYFLKPLSPPGTAAYDDRLVGSWIARDEEENVLLLRIEPFEDGEAEGTLLISATTSTIRPDDENFAFTGWFNLSAHASEVAGETYYNIRALEPGTHLVILDEAGVRSPPPPDMDWYLTPDPALSDYVRIQGQGSSFWMKGCGEFCSYARSVLSPTQLSEIIQAFPTETVFSFVAGPFLPLDTALPLFDSRYHGQLR